MSPCSFANKIILCIRYRSKSNELHQPGEANDITNRHFFSSNASIKFLQVKISLILKIILYVINFKIGSKQQSLIYLIILKSLEMHISITSKLRCKHTLSCSLWSSCVRSSGDIFLYQQSIKIRDWMWWWAHEWNGATRLGKTLIANTYYSEILNDFIS